AGRSLPARIRRAEPHRRCGAGADLTIKNRVSPVPWASRSKFRRTDGHTRAVIGQDARTGISIAIAAAAAVAIFGGPFAAAGSRPVPLVVLFKGASSMQTAAAEAGTPLAASSNSAPLALRADATRLSLAPPQVKGQAGLSERLRALAPEDQIYLILQ